MGALWPGRYRGGMSTPDQIAVAMLWGHAERCVAKRIPVDEAVVGLREITTRPDLLAQAAGTIAGSADADTPERAWHMRAARLLVQAGADRERLPRWIQQGRQNATQPARPGWGIPRVWPDDLDELLAEILDDARSDPPRLTTGQPRHASEP